MVYFEKGKPKMKSDIQENIKDKIKEFEESNLVDFIENNIQFYHKYNKTLHKL